MKRAHPFRLPPSTAGTPPSYSLHGCRGLAIYPDRKKRIAAIIDHLNTTPKPYDLVALQEVWMAEDWKEVREQCHSKYPHPHYFHSGILGSGLAVLARWPIERVAWYRFELNGKPYRITHGDWYAGKGIGCARVRISIPNESNGTVSITVDLLNTHLHAEYDKRNAAYAVHQLAQLRDLVRVFEQTAAMHSLAKTISADGEFEDPDGLVACRQSEDCHLILACGDMNILPGSTLHSAIFDQGAFSYARYGDVCIRDAWVDAREKCEEIKEAAGDGSRRRSAGDEEQLVVAGQETNSNAQASITTYDGATFNLPTSKYHNPRKTIQRIDYCKYAVLPGANSKFTLQAKSARVITTHNAQTLSDHSLLTVQFEVVQQQHQDSSRPSSALASSASTNGTATSNAMEEKKARIRQRHATLHRLSQLDQAVQDWFKRDVTSLLGVRRWFRAATAISTLLFLGLFISGLILVVWGGEAVRFLSATLCSLAPIPLTVSIVTTAIAEMSIPDELSAVKSLREEWRLWLAERRTSLELEKA